MQLKYINSVRMGILGPSLPSAVCHMGVEKVYNAGLCGEFVSYSHRERWRGGGGGVMILGHQPPTLQLCCSATATVYELSFF